MCPTMGIGTIGQGLVSTWISQADGTASPPSEDEHGWDLFTQFVTKSSATSPLDARRVLMNCFIQVKTTTDPEKKKDGIKISNWEKMAKEPFPYFIILVCIDEHTREPLSASMIHIDREWVKKTYKHLCTIDKAKLHKTRMNATWGDADRLLPPYGQSIRDQVFAATGEDLHQYIETKKDWRATVGFDTPRPHSFTIRTELDFSPYDTQLEMAKFAVKLRELLPVRFLSLSRTRFGQTHLYDPLDLTDKDNLFIESKKFPPTWAKGRVSICPKDHPSFTASLSGPIYCSHSVFPFLPPSAFMLRVEGPWWDVLFDNKTIQMQLKPKPETKILLATGANLSRFIRITLAPTDVRLTIAIPNLPTDEIQFHPQKNEVPTEFLHFLGALEALDFIRHQANLPLDTQMSASSIEQIAQKARIIHALWQGGAVQQYHIQPEMYDGSHITDGTRVGAVNAIKLTVEDFDIWSVVVISGNSESISESTISLTKCQTTKLFLGAVAKGHSFDLSAIVDRFDRDSDDCKFLIEPALDPT